MNSHAQEKAFTLLEVMIALTILAIGAGGLMTALNHNVQQQHYLERKVFASWIAQNKLTELRTARTWSNANESDEKASMAEQEWNIHTSITETSNPNIHKAVVTISDPETKNTSLFSLKGFLGKY